jgi:hypothetical protein
MEVAGDELGFAEQLNEALLSAYPSYAQLWWFVRLRLRLSLDDFATPQDGLFSVVVALFRECETRGLLKKLLRQACRDLPGNPALKACERFLLPFSDTQLKALKKAARPLNLESRRLVRLARYFDLPGQQPTRPLDTETPDATFSRVIEDLADLPERPPSGVYSLHKFVRLLIADKTEMNEPTEELRQWIRDTGGGLALSHR